MNHLTTIKLFKKWIFIFIYWLQWQILYYYSNVRFLHFYWYFIKLEANGIKSSFLKNVKKI